MKNVTLIIRADGYTTMLFFNTKEVYARDLFDTERKARNYAKKYGYTVCEKLPENVAAFEYVN